MTLCIDDGWGQKTARRRGQGTGRMRHLKHVHRRAKNEFREGTTPKARVRKSISKWKPIYVEYK
jgi:hypothetical protein